MKITSIGEQITGKVAGIIIKKQQLPDGPRSWPIVVWEQNGLRFIIDVGDLLEQPPRWAAR